MSVRGIDTQMLATKPADLSAAQAKINKQNETQMAQNATVITKTKEHDAERTIAATSAEGKEIGTEEREHGNGGHGSTSERNEGEPKKQEKEKWVDPMLSLPVEKGKFAKPKKHYIDIGV